MLSREEVYEQLATKLSRADVTFDAEGAQWDLPHPGPGLAKKAMGEDHRAPGAVT